MTTNPPPPPFGKSLHLDRIAARAAMPADRPAAVDPAPPLFSAQRHSDATPPAAMPVPGNELPTFLAPRPEPGQAQPC